MRSSFAKSFAAAALGAAAVVAAPDMGTAQTPPCAVRPSPDGAVRTGVLRALIAADAARQAHERETARQRATAARDAARRSGDCVLLAAAMTTLLLAEPEARREEPAVVSLAIQGYTFVVAAADMWGGAALDREILRLASDLVALDDSQLRHLGDREESPFVLLCSTNAPLAACHPLARLASSGTDGPDARVVEALRSRDLGSIRHALGDADRIAEMLEMRTDPDDRERATAAALRVLGALGRRDIAAVRRHGDDLARLATAQWDERDTHVTRSEEIRTQFAARLRYFRDLARPTDSKGRR